MSGGDNTSPISQITPNLNIFYFILHVPYLLLQLLFPNSFPFFLPLSLSLLPISVFSLLIMPIQFPSSCQSTRMPADADNILTSYSN